MDKNETEETVAEDKPDLRQSALVVCSLFLAELKRANEIYPSASGRARKHSVRSIISLHEGYQA